MTRFCGPDVIAGIFLVGLELFGAAWSAKQHERYAYYLRRAREYRDALITVDFVAVLASPRCFVRRQNAGYVGYVGYSVEFIRRFGVTN